MIRASGMDRGLEQKHYLTSQSNRRCFWWLFRHCIEDGKPHVFSFGTLGRGGGLQVCETAYQVRLHVPLVPLKAFRSFMDHCLRLERLGSTKAWKDLNSSCWLSFRSLDSCSFAISACTWMTKPIIASIGTSDNKAAPAE